jgi:hypothetical protein
MRNKPNIPSKSNIPTQWYEKYLKELSEEDKNKLLSKPMPKLNTSIPSEKPSSTYVRPKEAFNTIEEAKRRDIPKSETVEYLKELQSKFKQPNPITGEYELATGRAAVAGGSLLNQKLEK